MSSTQVPNARSAFVYVQDGGSSGELYIHCRDTAAEAEASRIECAEDGVYRTSPAIEVPASLAAHPDFLRIAEEIVDLTTRLELAKAADKPSHAARRS